MVVRMGWPHLLHLYKWIYYHHVSFARIIHLSEVSYKHRCLAKRNFHFLSRDCYSEEKAPQTGAVIKILNHFITVTITGLVHSYSSTLTVIAFKGGVSLTPQIAQNLNVRIKKKNKWLNSCVWKKNKLKCCEMFCRLKMEKHQGYYLHWKPFFH